MKKTTSSLKPEMKIIPVDVGGFIIKTYDTDGDQRVPKQTLVARDLPDLEALIRGIYFE